MLTGMRDTFRHSGQSPPARQGLEMAACIDATAAQLPDRVRGRASRDPHRSPGGKKNAPSSIAGVDTVIFEAFFMMPVKCIDLITASI